MDRTDEIILLDCYAKIAELAAEEDMHSKKKYNENAVASLEKEI